MKKQFQTTTEQYKSNKSYQRLTPLVHPTSSQSSPRVGEHLDEDWIRHREFHCKEILEFNKVYVRNRDRILERGNWVKK
jgi:hypothetical protein